MKTRKNSETKTSRFTCAGSALPAVLVIATVAISLILNASISRKVAATLSKPQMQAAEQDSQATARFSWDVRTAVCVARASANEIVLNQRDGVPVIYNFDATARTLTRTKGIETTTVLGGVDSIAFSLFERPAVYNQLRPATSLNAGVVGLKWTMLCSTDAVGIPQSAIASIQLAAR